MALRIERVIPERAAARKCLADGWAGMSRAEIEAALEDPALLRSAVALLLAAVTPTTQTKDTNNIEAGA